MWTDTRQATPPAILSIMADATLAELAATNPVTATTATADMLAMAGAPAADAATPEDGAIRFDVFLQALLLLATSAGYLRFSGNDLVVVPKAGGQVDHLTAGIRAANGGFTVAADGTVVAAGNVSGSNLTAGGVVAAPRVVANAIGFQPPTVADAAAIDNAIYYSSDQNALCYKDASSVVHPLY